MAGKEVVGAFKKIFSENLGARPGETVLVFTDVMPDPSRVEPVERERREGLIKLAKAASEAAGETGLNVRYLEYPALESHGTEPGPELWRLAFGEEAVRRLEKGGLLDAIINKSAAAGQLDEAGRIVRANKDAAVDAVVALSNNSTSHTRFRDLLTSEAEARYASMPLFEEDMLWGSMDVDWPTVERRAAALAEGLKNGEEVRVTTPDGTDISFSIKGRTARLDTGVLTEPGSFSNLPAGEVYLAPVEGSANGVLVLNWAPNQRLESPLRVSVADGFVGDVAGDDPYAKRLTAGLDKNRMNRNIAELGIGVNDKASRPDNILESEKILGTVHIAFGDNSSMGGKVSTPFHQDFVFFRPTLTVARGGVKTVLIREGRLLTGGADDQNPAG